MLLLITYTTKDQAIFPVRMNIDLYLILKVCLPPFSERSPWDIPFVMMIKEETMSVSGITTEG